MATATKTVKKAPAKKTSMLSEGEIEALKDTRAERKKGASNGEPELRAAIAKLDAADQTIADKLDAVVRANAPGLSGKTWYGLPAWAGADGKAVVFMTPASKFKERYSSIGFSASAKLDDGNMLETSFAVLKLGDAEVKKLTAMVKKAVS